MNWKRKLTSRKFWAAVVGVVLSVMVMFGASAEEQEKVTGLITSCGVHHSREYFQQTLEDVDTYEKYCAAHPDYKNNTCTLAIEHIRRVYATLQDKGF